MDQQDPPDNAPQPTSPYLKLRRAIRETIAPFLTGSSTSSGDYRNANASDRGTSAQSAHRGVRHERQRHLFQHSASHWWQSSEHATTYAGRRDACSLRLAGKAYHLRSHDVLAVQERSSLAQAGPDTNAPSCWPTQCSQ